MAEYTLFFRNDKTKSYNLFGWFIISLNLIFVIYTGLTADGIPAWLIIGFLSLYALTLTLQLWFRNSAYKFGLHPYFIIGAIFWLLVGFIPAFVLLVALELLHMIATKEPSVFVCRSHISYPSFFTKKAAWEKLNNLILKDGILTIDFRNDKMIQQIIDESKTSVNEKEFNDFCREQLNVNNII